MCVNPFSSKQQTPPVVYESPKADQAAAEAEAAGKSAQDKTARRRRMRASSLLATGATGDTSATLGGVPLAAGKPNLGA